MSLCLASKRQGLVRCCLSVAGAARTSLSLTGNVAPALERKGEQVAVTRETRPKHTRVYLWKIVVVAQHQVRGAERAGGQNELARSNGVEGSTRVLFAAHPFDHRFAIDTPVIDISDPI